MTDLVLSGLVSSRICHDLISPVGAIDNGMELLRLSVGAAGRGEEEIGLIADCASAASASLKFLRLAFGARDVSEMISTRDLSAVSNAHLSRRRVALDWSSAPESLTIGAGRALFLLGLTAASALPRGGALTIEAATEQPLSLAWRAAGDRLRMQSRIAELIETRPRADDVAPGEVHILLLWLMAEDWSVAPFWSETGEDIFVGVA